MELCSAASSGEPENHMPYGLDRLPEASQNHAPYGLCYGFRYRFVCSLRVYTDAATDWILEFGYGLLDFVILWILRVFWIRLGGPRL